MKFKTILACTMLLSLSAHYTIASSCGQKEADRDLGDEFDDVKPVVRETGPEPEPEKFDSESEEETQAQSLREKVKTKRR